MSANREDGNTSKVEGRKRHTAGRRAEDKEAREAERESGRGDHGKEAGGKSEATEIRSPDYTTDIFSVWDKCAI